MRVVLIAITLAFLSANAHAFDNNETHKFITSKASNLNLNFQSYLINTLGFVDKLNTVLPTNSGNKIIDWLTIGSDVEDVPVCRAANHFHNPLLPWNQSQSSDLWPQDQICRAQGWTPRYSNIFWATGALSPSDSLNNPPSPCNLQDMGYDNARQYFHNALTAPTAPIREI